MQPVSSNPFDLFTVATVRISVYHITLGGSPFFATMLIHSPNVTVRDCLTCSTSRQLSSQGRDIPNGDKHTSFVFRKTDSSPGKRYLHCRQLQVRLRLVSQTLLKFSSQLTLRRNQADMCLCSQSQETLVPAAPRLAPRLRRAHLATMKDPSC